MIDVFFIILESIRKDTISLVFTQIILVFFFIGALPGFMGLVDRLLKQLPFLNQEPKTLADFLLVGVLGIVISICLGLLSWVFSVIFLILFFAVVSPRLKSLNILSVHPSLLTTIGILGTFVGVYIGLAEFDIGNIDVSIPILLRGLKIAFTTSIVGITAAIILKIVQSNLSKGKSGENVFDVFDNMNKTLKDHLEQSKSQHQEMLKKTQKNMDMQSKMIQFLYSKINSLEGSLKESLKSSAIKKNIQNSEQS